MTKYREVLWKDEPKENPFQVGDRVNTYGAHVGVAQPFESTVLEVFSSGMLRLAHSKLIVHFRQCRLLEPVAVREWWVISEDGIPYIRNEQPGGELKRDASWFKVREVLEDE